MEARTARILSELCGKAATACARALCFCFGVALILKGMGVFLTGQVIIGIAFLYVFTTFNRGE